MKRLKKILYLTTMAVVILTIGYFVFAYSQINTGIKQEEFMHEFYRTKANNGFVSFGSFKNTVICYDDLYYFIDKVSYDKGIFTLENRDNEKIYKISVIDKDTIYLSDFNTYFFNIKLF